MDGDIIAGDGGGIIRRGTGIRIPARFTPSNWLVNPAPEFFFCMKPSLVLSRYIPRERLVLYEDRHTGWAFHFGPQPQRRTVSRQLESRGPFGDVAEQTSNRAELRAAIAATRGSHWWEDGFSRLVIASDSDYLVQGITAWDKRWIENGWKTSEGEAVKNRDLWEMLLGDVELWAEDGGTIEFWRIPREYIRSLMVRQRERLGNPTWRNSTVRLWRTGVESRPD